MSDDQVDDVSEALDERIAWIKAVVSRGLRDGVLAIRDEVAKLDAETARSILFVRLVHYQAEGERLSEQITRDQFEKLDDKGMVMH